MRPIPASNRPILKIVSLVVPPFAPARFTNDQPESVRGFGASDQPPDHDSFGTVRYHYLADQWATGDDNGLYRVDLAPKAGGPGPHFQRA
jgi:hypothetical protein